MPSSWHRRRQRRRGKSAYRLTSGNARHSLRWAALRLSGIDSRLVLRTGLSGPVSWRPLAAGHGPVARGGRSRPRARAGVPPVPDVGPRSRGEAAPTSDARQRRTNCGPVEKRTVRRSRLWGGGRGNRKKNLVPRSPTVCLAMGRDELMSSSCNDCISREAALWLVGRRFIQRIRKWHPFKC